MRVVVDYDVCVSSGTCAQVAPDVFELRAGELFVRQEEPPESQRDQVTAAEELCPTGAITVEG